MSDEYPKFNLHTVRPSIYLDQWVWSRLAAAAAGRPREPIDSNVLDAVVRASHVGVAFPLSSTHYIETLSVPEVVQRAALSETMSSISHIRTLRSRHLLLRDQILTSVHSLLELPEFVPTQRAVLGVGVNWAFEGEVKQLTIHGPNEFFEAVRIPFTPRVLCRMAQWLEIQYLMGPRDEEIERLRTNFGYQPETAQEAARLRLEWEELYVGLLGEDPVSTNELRARVQARELIREHLDILTSIFEEYDVTFHSLFGGSIDEPGSARPGVSAFFESVPSLRIATEMKTNLFRDPSRTWKINDLHDIDALSLAIPYCHVVISDKAAVDSVRKSKIDHLCGTKVIAVMAELIDILPPLEEQARNLGGDVSGWDWNSPGVGFDPASPDVIAELLASR